MKIPFLIIGIPISVAGGVNSQMHDSIDGDESEDCFDDTSIFRVRFLYTLLAGSAIQPINSI